MGILVALFAMQSFGTERVSFLFRSAQEQACCYGTL